MFGIAGAALGPPPFAASVDWMGSYVAVLTACSVLCLGYGGGGFAVRRPSSLAKPMKNCRSSTTG